MRLRPTVVRCVRLPNEGEGTGCDKSDVRPRPWQKVRHWVSSRTRRIYGIKHVSEKSQMLMKGVSGGDRLRTKKHIATNEGQSKDLKNTYAIEGRSPMMLNAIPNV